jgi:hypothetical protein
VRAILAGRKTVTRRPVTPQPAPNAPHDGGTEWVFNPKSGLHVPHGTVGHLGVRDKTGLRCPFGVAGDRLWVRERARLVEVESGEQFVSGVGEARVRLRYETDGSRSDWLPYPPRLSFFRVGHCVPNGVHREGARLFLEVLSVRVERLHDVTEEDARAEGFEADPEDAPLSGRRTTSSGTRGSICAAPSPGTPTPGCGAWRSGA